MRKPVKKIVRLAEVAGRFYWKPETRLRAHFKSVALGADRRAAEAEARRLNGEVAQMLAKHGGAMPGKAPSRRQGSISFGELCARFRASDDWKQLRPASRENYTFCLKLLEAEFAHEVAGTITPSRVDDWLDGVKRHAPRGVSHYLGRGGQVWAWGRRKGLVAGENPFQGHHLRRPVSGKRAVRWTWEDVRALVAAADAAGRLLSVIPVYH